MKTSRMIAGVVATLAMFAGDYAHADSPAAAGDTVVLNTFTTVWKNGDKLGPVDTNGVARIGKFTGAGLMDAFFQFQPDAPAGTQPTSVLLGAAFTRSGATRNANSNNDAYVQGGFVTATLTADGVKPGLDVDLPRLDGERTWMRPTIGFTAKHAILFAASEDNGINNNPQISLFVADKTTGAIVPIPNSTRGATNVLKPANIVQIALKQGINVPNPNNQRGPHSIAQTGPNSFVIGNQYNNQAQEAFGVSVADDATVKVDWYKRFSNNAQHCRPQVVVAPGATVGYITSVEANNQPAEIGFRVTKFDVKTGNVIASKIAVRSDPKANKYVAEPAIALAGDKLAIAWSVSASVGRRANNGNGHAGGSQVSALALFDTTTLDVVGTPMLGAAAYGRHSNMFATTYGDKGLPALAMIGGSSTGTKGAFQQIIPLTDTGAIGLKDPAKLYAVSSFSDVANVQARGKRNPNDQARGFINGLGSVPNPGFTTDATKAKTSFMPEVKTLSFSTVTGYTDAAGAALGKRNSIYLSLVPASWDGSLKTTPGSPTSTPGVGTNGQPSQVGPAPRTTAPATDPSGSATSKDDTGSVVGGDATTPDEGSRAALGGDQGGCNVSSTSSSSSGAGFIFLAVAGVIIALRRKQEEV